MLNNILPFILARITIQQKTWLRKEFSFSYQLSFQSENMKKKNKKDEKRIKIFVSLQISLFALPFPSVYLNNDERDIFNFIKMSKEFAKESKCFSAL